MQARLGAAWNPTDALLQWTMSQAADDQTSNPHYQNLTFRRHYIESNGLPLVGFVGPDALIVGGSSTQASALRGPGTTGFFVIDDDQLGGSYVPGASIGGVAAPDAVAWLILRVR